MIRLIVNRDGDIFNGSIAVYDRECGIHLYNVKSEMKRIEYNDALLDALALKQEIIQENAVGGIDNDNLM